MTGARVGMRAAVASILAAVVLSAYVLTPERGYTFATEGLNLKIDSHAVYNGVEQPGSTWALKNLVPGVDKFFNFNDIKPGDHGEATISFHVNKDAWICLDFEKLKEKENGENEPESHVDVGPPAEGELADGTEFFAWYDDGDDLFEIGEKPIFGTSSQSAVQVLKNTTYVLADSVSGTPFPANQTKYIGITWCAGNLSVNLAAATVLCDGSVLGNDAQTDSFSVDVSFRAVPSKDNKKFKCDKGGQKCERSGCNNCGGPVHINVSNNGTVNSTTTSSSNTGGNSAGSGGTVITGDASSTATSTNILNRVRALIRR